MRYVFSILFVLPLLGCGRSLSPSVAEPTPNPAISPTETIIQPLPRVNREVDAQRVEALRDKRPLIESYITKVDESINSILDQTAIPTMTRHDWRTDPEWENEPEFHPEMNHYSGYSVSLWRETKPKDRFIRLSLRCNISCDDGIVRTPVAPNPEIRKPAHDLRFDWHIQTGDQDLDQKIREIVISEAKKF